MHESRSQVLRLAARDYQKQEGTQFTPSQFNTPLARVRERQEGETEAPGTRPQSPESGERHTGRSAFSVCRTLMSHLYWKNLSPCFGFSGLSGMPAPQKLSFLCLSPSAGCLHTCS